MANPKNNKVTVQRFACVKQLLKAGSTAKEISEYLSMSTSTIYRIDQAETLEEYEHNTYVRTQAARAAKAAEARRIEEPEPEPQPVPAAPPPEQVVVHRHEQSVTLIANHFMAEELRKQTELLALISNKLAVIIDDLYGTSTKGDAR